MLSKTHRVYSCFRTELTRKLCTLVNTPSPNRSRSPTREKWTRKPTSSPTEAATCLYSSLSALRNGTSFDQVLNDWISTQGKSVSKDDILVSVDYLRRFKKFDQALQLLEWTEKRGLICLSVREHAICLVLIGKIRGVKAAEKYFNDLPESAKKKPTYGALLHCYCCVTRTEKAMALFQKMQALNFSLNSFDYCSLMSLQMKLGQPENIPLLDKEMRENGIKPHIFSYKLLINAYASLKDIKAVEKVEEEIKTVSGIRPDWAFYSNLAAIYIAAGLLEKAELALKEVERFKLRDPMAFHYLLTLYASIGKAEEVNRVWESLKSAFRKTSNLSYLTRLQALFKLEDMDGLKRCFEEWELSCSSYDVRLPNVLIKSYLKRDMIEEAKSLLDHILKKGYEPNFATYILFIEFFMKFHEVDAALKFMKLGTGCVKKEEAKAYERKARIYLKYFEKKGDVSHAEEFYRILKEADHLDPELRGSLLRTDNKIWERRASDSSENSDDAVDTFSDNEVS